MIHANEKMKKLNVLIEKNPIVSMGILYWLEKILASFSNGGHTGSGHRSGGIGGTSGTGGLELNGSLLSVCFPNFLKILRTSIRFHIAQWPFVFQVLVISLRIQQNVSTTTTTSTTGGSHSGSSTVGMTNNTTGSITTGSVSTGSSSNTMTLPNTSSTSGSSSTSSGDIGGGGGGGVNTTTTNMMNPVKAFELKRQTLRCMVFMMINGYVLPVLEFIYKNIFELDLALLRYFICMVFEKIDAPFSKEFMFQVIQILMHPKVQNAIKTNCPIETKNKLKLFVLQCQKKNNNKEEEERFVLPEQLQALMALMST
jgi:hypothetical protein